MKTEIKENTIDKKRMEEDRKKRGNEKGGNIKKK